MKLDIKTLAIAVILSVIISSIITYTSMPTQPRVVSVDLKGILKEFIVKSAQSKMGEMELSAHISGYTGRLDNVLKAISVQENLIVLPKKAVISGSLDITDQVKNLINQGYGEKEKTDE
jgi:type-F conjugative transfer system protein TrbI